jgi:hypothetical protein
VAVALTAVLAGVAFTVVGGLSGTAVDPVAEAATVSSNAAGYRMRFSMEIVSSAIPTPITGTGTGSFDAPDRSASISFAMNLGSDPRVISALGTNILRMREILDGSTVYMKLPAALMSALPTSGKRWIAVDLSKLAGVPGLSSMESNPVSSDPSQMLQFLRAVSDSIVAAGHERVDGEETTRYQADLSLDRVTDALPSGDQAAARQALSTLEQSMRVHEIPVDVWIDAQHLVRRITMTFDAGTAGGQTLDEALTMDISDYGPQRRPALPAAADVTSLAGLTG